MDKFVWHWTVSRAEVPFLVGHWKGGESKKDPLKIYQYNYILVSWKLNQYFLKFLFIFYFVVPEVPYINFFIINYFYEKIYWFVWLRQKTLEFSRSILSV
jgi:hypothetical protein